MRALPNRITVDTAGPQKKRVTKEHLERDVEKEMWTAGFRYSWRKMEVSKK